MLLLSVEPIFSQLDSLSALKSANAEERICNLGAELDEMRRKRLITAFLATIAVIFVRF